MSQFSAGSIGVLGLPNAGKSTLVNALVGEKVSIVSSKPQTTRQRICGIFNDKRAQILFFDAPGVIENERGLNSFLKKEYQAVVQDADALLVVLNLDEEKRENLDQIIELAVKSGKPCIAVINKVDLGLIHRAGYLRSQLSIAKIPFLDCSAIRLDAALKLELLERLIGFLPESPAPLYDAELWTTQSVRQMVAEIIREKCFLNLYHEVPYNLAIRIVSFDEEPKIIRIQAEIVTGKPGHKAIVIGKGGTILKKIGTDARIDIEKLVGVKVFLQLHVQVRENWIKNRRMLKEFGYVAEQP